MLGLSAVTVAPLIALPESSLTRPLTRPTCAAASPANKALKTNATTTCRHFARIINTPEAAQSGRLPVYMSRSAPARRRLCPPQVQRSGGSEQPGGLVQQDVDQDAGYRNVEPDGQRPPGDCAMRGKAPL